MQFSNIQDLATPTQKMTSVIKLFSIFMIIFTALTYTSAEPMHDKQRLQADLNKLIEAHADTLDLAS